MIINLNDTYETITHVLIISPPRTREVQLVLLGPPLGRADAGEGGHEHGGGHHARADRRHHRHPLHRHALRRGDSLHPALSQDVIGDVFGGQR